MRTGGNAPVTVSHLTPPTDHRARLISDVSNGFTAYRKHLPSKYFYDARGSELFEEITRLPEYYLTQAETDILTANAGTMMARLLPDEIVELGSGSSRKTLIMIEAMRAAGAGSRYVPIDISEDALTDAARHLCSEYDWLEVEALVGDYIADLDKVRRRGRRLVMFLGSTIGNYVPTLRYSLLRAVAAALDPGDEFLLGVDLVKDEATMMAAYNDSQGVSAEFNLNILNVINRELDGDIPLEAFSHETRFDAEASCMVQSLRAKRKVVANLRALDLAVTFLAGEEIHTEVSCKFTQAEIEDNFSTAGISLEDWLTDPHKQFAVAVGRTAPGSGV